MAGSALAAVCPGDLPPPTVALTVERGAMRIDHTLDPAEIGAVRARLNGAAVQPRPGRTVGLTVAALRIGKATRGRLLPAIDQDGLCVQVTHVDLRVGFLDQTVYVPRSYAPGSCEYEAVLEHERAHVADNLAVLDNLAQSFRSRAEDLALTMNPVRATSREEARSRPVDLVSAALAPVAEDFAQAQADHAARRDSQEEYAAIAARCRNW
ncbi:hypothetical protein ACM64Y_01235 [Novispirillum sp. DQ9]|uniref:hypothetical protein n=1 Tax=Novispirillum sp. DQ9 TaxID=3398612 RepID=UPI003C7A17D5